MAQAQQQQADGVVGGIVVRLQRLADQAARGFSIVFQGRTRAGLVTLTTQ